MTSDSHAILSHDHSSVNSDSRVILSDGHSSTTSDSRSSMTSDHRSSVTDSLKTTGSDDVFLPCNVETPQRGDNEACPVTSTCKKTAGRCPTSQVRSTATDGMAQEENTPNLFLDDYLLQNSYAARNLRSLRDGSYSESIDGSSCGQKSLSLNTSHDDLQIKKKSSVKTSESDDDCRNEVLAMSGSAGLAINKVWEAAAIDLCESKELERCEVTDGSIGRGMIIRRSMLEFYNQSDPSFWSSASSGGQKRLFDSVDTSESSALNGSHTGAATGLTQEIRLVSIEDEHCMKRGHFCRMKSIEVNSFGDSGSGNGEVKMNDMGEISMPSIDNEMEQPHLESTSCNRSDKPPVRTTPKQDVPPNFKPLFTSSCGSPTEVGTPPIKSMNTNENNRIGLNVAKTDSIMSKEVACIGTEATKMLQPADPSSSTKPPSQDVDTKSHGENYNTKPDDDLEFVGAMNMDWLRRPRRVPFADVCIEGLAHYSTRQADGTYDVMSPRYVNAHDMETSDQQDASPTARCTNVSLKTNHSDEDNNSAEASSSDRQSGYTADESSEACVSRSVESPPPAQTVVTGLSKYSVWEQRLSQADQPSQKDAPEGKVKKVTCFMSLPSSHSSDHGHYTPILDRNLRCRAFMVSSRGRGQLIMVTLRVANLPYVKDIVG